MKEFRLVAVLLTIVGLAACTAPAPSTDSSELAAVTEAWESAYNSGDADALAALYTEDTRLLPPCEDGAGPGRRQGHLQIEAVKGSQLCYGRFAIESVAPFQDRLEDIAIGI